MLRKVRAQLDAGAGRAAARLAVLVLPGAFAPVHREHIAALAVARDAVEAERGHVVGGFLVPSDDGYVSGKQDDGAWPLACRQALCRIATAASPWVEVTPWAQFGGFQAARSVHEEVCVGCADLVQGRKLETIVVMGSDSAARVLRRLLAEHTELPKRPATQWICCIQRPGSAGAEEMARIQATLADRVRAHGIRVLDAGRRADRLRPVSSEAIRAAIAAQSWDKLARHDWLDAGVLRELRAGRPG